MKLFLVMATALLFSGCATVIPSKPVETKVIVSVPCKIAPISKPAMPLDSAKPEDDILTKVKLALGEIETRKAYEIKLETAVKTCQ